MRLSRFTVVTISTAMALAACGGEDTTSDTTTSDTTATTPAPEASDTPTNADGDGPTTSSCVGTPGDGNGAELEAVELKLLGENLQVTFHTEAPLPTTDMVSFRVDAWDMDGEKGYRLGVETDRRGDATQYVVAAPDGTRTEVDQEIESTGTTLIATYPMSMLESLGRSFQWSAILDIGEELADSCPAVGDDPLQPERVDFAK